jgi:hypothetical protein
MADLQNMPKGEAKVLMKEACLYASLKLFELESRGRFLHDIQAP